MDLIGTGHRYGSETSQLSRTAPATGWAVRDSICPDA